MVSSFVEAEARRSVLTQKALDCGYSPELERLVALAADMFQVSHGAIWVSDGTCRRIIAGFGLEGGLEDELKQALGRERADRPNCGVDTGGTEARSGRIGFLQHAPLSCGSEIVGCLAIADERPRRFGRRDAALLERLATVALDQLYLVCVTRKQSELGRKRMAEVRASAAENRALQKRLRQVARLGCFGGWVLDIESDQILWTDDLPGDVVVQTRSLTADKVLSLYERSGREQIRRALRRAIEHGVPLEVEHPIRLSDGEMRWLRMVGEFEAGEGTAGRVIGIIQDVTERYRADEKITFLSQFDPLTGLPNRTAFQDRLQAAVRWAERAGCRGAVLVLDIDGFSELNDAFGTDGGDAALARLGESLRAVVRACDSVARIGGDRFAVTMVGMDSAGDAMKLAERLIEIASATLPDGTTGPSLTASVGIALFPTDGATATQLLRAAETALCRAKEAGGGAYAFFTAEMSAVVEHRRQLMAEVHSGLQAGQFVVAYQPKIDLRSNRLAGFEALIRWAHPERGLLSPSVFWEALADPRYGKQLSDAVLHEVVRQLAIWRQAGLETGPVAVNVAAGQLRDPNFLDQITTLLHKAELPPSALRLEITEGVLFGRRSDRTVRALNAIHEIGIATELDDFGTGYASLTHLREFAVDRLKIDKSFVTELAEHRNDTIVRAVIEMAHGLDMEVIAEGVERAETDRRLRQLGCDYAQGFYYSRPIAAESVPGVVQRWRDAAGGGLCAPSAETVVTA